MLQLYDLVAEILIILIKETSHIHHNVNLVGTAFHSHCHV